MVLGRKFLASLEAPAVNSCKPANSPFSTLLASHHWLLAKIQGPLCRSQPLNIGKYFAGYLRKEITMG